jgi:CO/xanthine dehydrogenase FAD-binding subunit
MGTYFRPTELSDALEALAEGALEIVAGGTDYYPARVGPGPGEDVLDITALGALRGIEEDAAGFRIGALATWTDLARAALPPAFDGLKQAALQIGGPQIQNAGTVCGNLCNASPAADGTPNLLCLNASVEVMSRAGARAVPLPEFLLGNRRTVLEPGELVTGIVVPKPGAGARATFLKLGARRYLVISIVMVAALIEPDGAGRVARAAVAVGACTPVAARLPALEAELVGRPLDAALGEALAPEHLAALAPIDDIRANANYRLDAAATLVRRALGELGAGFGDGP